MADPGTIGSIAPPGEDYIVRRIADLERKVRELGPSIAQSFNATVAQLNQVIDSEIAPQSDLASGAGLAVTTTSTVQASVSFTVPDGYTRAIILANATAAAVNSTASGDYLYARVLVNGGDHSSAELYNAAQAAWATSVCQPYNVTLTGLTGGSTVTVSAAVRSSAAGWAASGSNLTTIYAQVLFLR